ncbi:MAG: hypothetical protein P4L91_06695 [Burkholderiaceae bacterium]|nr:hypothetical protein [Burkholderiaceae bacterium]
MAQKLHPIQLQGIRVAELYLKILDPNEAQKDDLNLPFTFSTGHSSFDQDSNQISVGVFGQIGTDDEDAKSSPFVMKVNVFGQFLVDVTEFPVDQINKWASENAPLILLPFLREHIYGLASRAGIREVIVPLYVVPTYTVQRPVSNN